MSDSKPKVAVPGSDSVRSGVGSHLPLREFSGFFWSRQHSLYLSLGHTDDSKHGESWKSPEITSTLVSGHAPWQHFKTKATTQKRLGKRGKGHSQLYKHKTRN